LRGRRKRIFSLRSLIYFLLLLIPAFYTARSFRFPSVKENSFANQSGLVSYVYDGDTFRIKLRRGEKRVRLLGVDTAEVGDPHEEVDLWARLARRFSYFHLFQKTVSLSFEAEREDRYGRLLAYVWLDNKILFNELIIREGLADYYSSSSLRPEMQARLEKAEAQARGERKGKWQERWPTPLPDKIIRHHRGEIQAVHFICGSLRTERNYTLLLSRSGDFQVFIPKDRRPLFSVLEKVKPGDELIVFGLIEEYRGKPQVMLFYPRQIKLSPNLSEAK